MVLRVPPVYLAAGEHVRMHWADKVNKHNPFAVQEEAIEHCLVDPGSAGRPVSAEEA